LRILLIGYLYGISSERKLVEELRMHLAWRWFTGLGFDEEVPHHSTFSKNRHGRFQESKLFEQLFEQVVAQCMAVGLVHGDKLSVDGTFVEANACKESRIPRDQLAEAAQVNRTVREYLAELERQNPVEEPTHNQDKVSTTDPDSTYATKGGTPARMGYYNNYLVDNHSCIVVGVQATGARLSEESRAARDMIARFAACKDENQHPSLPMPVMATVNSCSGWWTGRLLHTCLPEMRSGEQEVPSMVLNALRTSLTAIATSAQQASN